MYAWMYSDKKSKDYLNVRTRAPCSNGDSFLTSLLLTEPDWGASLIYSSIVARNDGGGWLVHKRI